MWNRKLNQLLLICVHVLVALGLTSCIDPDPLPQGGGGGGGNCGSANCSGTIPQIRAMSTVLPVYWNYVFDSSNNLYSAASPGTSGSARGILKTSSSGAFQSFFSNESAILLAKDTHDSVYVITDSAGDFPVDGSDSASIAIRKISVDGTTSVICNSAQCASIGLIQGAAAGGGAVDSYGNLYIPFVSFAAGNAYAWAQIAKITPTGVYSIFSGANVASNGDPCLDGNANMATLSGPSRMLIDSSNTLYIFDAGIRNSSCNSIRKITPTGDVSTIHSFGSRSVGGLERDHEGNFYYHEAVNPGVAGKVIRKLSPAGLENTYCGGGADRGTENPSGTCSNFIPQIVGNLALDASGDLFFMLSSSANSHLLPYYAFYEVVKN